MIQKFEKLSMNAWPSLETQEYDGWLFRFAGGVTRRANSISPLFSSSFDIQKKIQYSEDIYLTKNLPVIYKITKESYPSNLDDILDEYSYKKEAETSFQVLDIINTMNLSEDVVIKSNFDDRWLDRLMDYSSIDIDKKDGYRSILKNIKYKIGYLDLIVDGEYLGCGLGVIEGKYVGIFDIVIDKKYRCKGYGRVVVESLISWANTYGVSSAYLQVTLDNSKALSLYEKLGFKNIYNYWYRVKRV